MDCGQQNAFTSQAFRLSEGSSALVPLDFPSLELSNEFIGLLQNNIKMLI